MADVMGKNASAVGEDLRPPQVELPANYEEVVALDDTDPHDFVVPAQGKGRGTIAIHNATDQTVTVRLYGCFHADDEVGDPNVHQIGGDFTVLTTAQDYDTFNDPFPFYLVRLVAAMAPDGSNVTLNLTLQRQ